MYKAKQVELFAPFVTKDMGEESDGSITITGYASTNALDRDGDIVISDVWNDEKSLGNYLKNPIVLAFHNPSRPIGKVISHQADATGLKVTARISKGAGDIAELIKDGVLSAFSIGFSIQDADYDPNSGVFAIKELELYEISVVSIPANQDSLFNLEKSFSSEEEFEDFKNHFIKETKVMGDEVKTESKQETKAPAVDLKGLAAEISQMVKSDLAKEAEEKAAKEAKEKARKEEISAIAVSGAEKLVADLRKDLADENKSIAEALAAVKDALKAQGTRDDLDGVFDSERQNNMRFEEQKKSFLDAIPTDKRDGFMYAAKAKGVPITELESFKEYVKKSGQEHWSVPADEWESEYSTRIMNALREQLVVEPVFTTIPMSRPTMNMPINPEAGDATWVHENAYRSSRNMADETGDGTNTSTGEAKNHQLGENTLIAYKLATREYIGYEEEEDSIVTLAPVIREAIARRMAISADKAILRGTGVTASGPTFDPITGIAGLGTATDITVAGGAGWAANFTEDAIVDMRRDLGIYGLDPSQLVLFVSHDLYYEMMKLPNFKTVDVLGDRATIITGQVGAIFGIQVVVSQAFDNAAITAGTVGTPLGTLVRTSNFVKGELRGVMTEAAVDVINQKRALVSSRRFAFKDIIAGKGVINLDIAV